MNRRDELPSAPIECRYKAAEGFRGSTKGREVEGSYSLRNVALTWMALWPFISACPASIRTFRCFLRDSPDMKHGTGQVSYDVYPVP